MYVLIMSFPTYSLHVCLSSLSINLISSPHTTQLYVLPSDYVQQQQAQGSSDSTEAKLVATEHIEDLD